jgi:transcriptional regulator with XRE-family HTH domain
MAGERGRRRTDVTQDIDIQVGKNIRMRRIGQKLSQKELAERLELTFQQVQKYEKGLNRIALSRAYQIAIILGCRVNDFLDGVDNRDIPTGNPVFSDETARAMQIFDKLPETAQRASMAVMKAFHASQSGEDDTDA